MVPGKYDITIYKGGTYDVGLTAKDSSEMTISFSKYTTIRMQVRPSWVEASTSVPPLLELTLANGGIIKSANELEISLNISAADTALLDFTDGIYDLELVVEESGKEDIVDKMLYGKVFVIQEVTV